MDGGSPLGGVAQVSSGGSHTCALLTTGRVYCWGANAKGQLGDGTLDDRLLPVEVPGLSAVVEVSSSSEHTCAVLSPAEDSGIRCWGDNSFGQLGTRTRLASSDPRAVLASASTQDSRLLSGAVQVSAGIQRTCAAMSDGSSRCWGHNIQGRLGIGVDIRVSLVPAIVQLAGFAGSDPDPVAFLLGTNVPKLETVLPSLSTSLALTCSPSPQVGRTVVCRVTGGEPSVELLWRAAYNPPFAGEGVTLDDSGVGEFWFTVPPAAFGQEVTVELVDRLAPVSLGVVGGPVPVSIPAGEGPVPLRSLVVVVLMGWLMLQGISRPGPAALEEG